MKRFLVVAGSVAALAGLAACGSGDPSAGSDGRLEVSASFYPLQFAAERIGGDHVDVTALTKPGAEPHDLELTPRDVGGMASSDVILYLEGFQPAVDQAVAQEAADRGFDVTPWADLSITATEEGQDHDSGSTDASEETGPGARDPHFWLDPVRFEGVADAIAARFAQLDPPNAAEYARNGKALVSDLKALDAEFRTGLASCATHELVTAHAAFAYLAERYGFSQEGIAGISPDTEPDAATLRTLADIVRTHHVSTVYSELLVSPALADTLARETGAAVAVLDPVEGVTPESRGTNYLEIMRSNLATLEKGQRCA